MESIRDLSWMSHLASGEVLERFDLNGYSAVAVLIRADSERRGESYRYRILFTMGGERRPVYAINLEASILGAWMITEQEAGAHRVVQRISAPLDYEKFRVIALERAVVRLEKPR